MRNQKVGIVSYLQSILKEYLGEEHPDQPIRDNELYKENKKITSQVDNMLLFNFSKVCIYI